MAKSVPSIRVTRDSISIHSSRARARSTIFPRALANFLYLLYFLYFLYFLDFLSFTSVRSRRQPPRHVFLDVGVEKKIQLVRQRSGRRGDRVPGDFPDSNQIPIRRRNENFIR